MEEIVDVKILDGVSRVEGEAGWCLAAAVGFDVCRASKSSGDAAAFGGECWSS